MGHGGREEEAAKVGAPPKPNLNWWGGFPFSFSFSFFLLFLVGLGKGGVLLLLGGGLLPLGAPRGPAGLPLPPLYTWGGGTLEHIKVDCLAVCGAPLLRIPPRSYRCSA